MSDPRGPGWSDPSAPSPSGYPPNTDPAYGQYPGQYWGHTYYGPGQEAPGYQAPGYGSPVNQPTEQLPVYWQPGSGYPPAQPPTAPPPEPPKSPRWLWAVAAAAVLLVAGLVFALVIVSSSTKDTVVAPEPSTTPRLTTPTRTTTAPRTTIRVPSPTTSARPEPTTSAEPTLPIPLPLPPNSTTTAPTGTETVVYTVSGQGRAINITYVDTGGIMQTEFNVVLPWSKEVSLSAPGKKTASVAVVNVGRDVTCSITVNGAQVRQRTGQGLTICAGFA